MVLVGSEIGECSSTAIRRALDREVRFIRMSYSYTRQKKTFRRGQVILRTIWARKRGSGHRKITFVLQVVVSDGKLLLIGEAFWATDQVALLRKRTWARTCLRVRKILLHAYVVRIVPNAK